MTGNQDQLQRLSDANLCAVLDGNDRPANFAITSNQVYACQIAEVVLEIGRPALAVTVDKAYDQRKVC